MKKIITILTILISSIAYSQSLPHKIDVDDQIIYNNGYTLSYNETCEQPNWVMYTLTPEDLKGEKVKRKNVFKQDKAIPTGSATLEDYKGSGYDRGHLKPAGDEGYDREQMDETFKMSNMSPQDPSFNRGVWKTIENYVRKVALASDSVTVYTGGVLVGRLKTIGESKVCIPEFYYKVIYTYNDGKKEVICFLIKNEKSKEPLYTYRVKLKHLEDFIKIKF